MVSILVPTVAFYAIYRGLDPGLTRFLRLQAKKNASIAIGIDILIFRPSTRRSSEMRSLASSFVESIRHFVWYLSESLRGHVILPIPAIVTLIYGVRFILMAQPKPTLPRATAVDLYRLGWPEQVLAPEFMATYLRFIALEDELYGLHPYDDRFVRLYLFAKIYSSVIYSIFKVLPPAVYIAVYSGYIQHFIPCLHASKVGAPILLLGCSDCLYRIDDSAVPRQFLPLSSALGSLGEFDGQAIVQGQEILRKRIGGTLDSAIDYMPNSPFVVADSRIFWGFPHVAQSLYEFSFPQAVEVTGSVDKFVVVFMHELQDWHHNGVLPPFASSYYEWLLITVKYLLDSRLPFVIKIHPAIVSTPKRYQQTIHALCRMASGLNVLLPISTTLTTLGLIEMGMGLGLTVRGTIGLELAYLRVRFLCAGTPPYGPLFPRRTELGLSSYLHRLKHFQAEPEVSLVESSAASYYVGLQNKMISRPDVHLKTKVFHVSPDADFIDAKRYL